MRSAFSFLAAVSSFLPLLVPLLSSTVSAHNINLGAHSRECFHEQLHKDDKMTVTFQVGDREFGGAGNLEVDFWVGDWIHSLLWSAKILDRRSFEKYEGN